MKNDSVSERESVFCDTMGGMTRRQERTLSVEGRRKRGQWRDERDMEAGRRDDSLPGEDLTYSEGVNQFSAE